MNSMTTISHRMRANRMGVSEEARESISERQAETQKISANNGRTSGIPAHQGTRIDKTV